MEKETETEGMESAWQESEDNENEMSATHADGGVQAVCLQDIPSRSKINVRVSVKPITVSRCE